MGDSQSWISYPDNALIELAKLKFHDLLYPDMVPHVLLLCSMADHDREAIIEAAQHVSIFPLQQRLQVMSLVSEWKARNASPWSDDSSASASLRGARSSLASATPATSTLPSSAASRRNSSRLSYDIGGLFSPANGPAFDNTPHYRWSLPQSVPGNADIGGLCSPDNGPALDNTPHYRWSLPHSVPGNAIPTLAFDAPINGPPHFPVNIVTQQVANEAINIESPLSQQSSGCPPTSLPETQVPRSRTQTTSNARPRDIAKWVCPVCGYGCTRSDTMKGHTKSQCLNRKIYQCLSCQYSTRKSKADIKKHCKDSAHVPDLGYEEYTPPARNIYASCLTGKVHSTEEELIDDTHQHCLGTKGIPPSDPNIRLKALLRALLNGPHGKQMEQEMKKQCLSWGVDLTSWLRLTWKREDALRLSDMAEYGLQCDAASTSSNRADIPIEVAASGSEQHKFGIVDLSDYVADLMRLGQQSELPYSPNVAAVQRPAMILPEYPTTGYELFAPDAQAQDFAMSEPTPSDQHHSLNDQTHNQGYTQSHASTYREHDPPSGRSPNRPQSVDMQDWSFSSD